VAGALRSVAGLIPLPLRPFRDVARQSLDARRSRAAHPCRDGLQEGRRWASCELDASGDGRQGRQAFRLDHSERLGAAECSLGLGRLRGHRGVHGQKSDDRVESRQADPRAPTLVWGHSSSTGAQRWEPQRRVEEVRDTLAADLSGA
jgi:hypothetical protein